MQLKSLSALFILFTLSIWSCNSQSTVKNINADAFDKGINQPDVQLIDVSTPDEYKERHIAGAINLNFASPSFEEQLSHFDKSRALYVYGVLVDKSAKASAIAVKDGFKQVYNLDGGLAAWTTAKKPLQAENVAAASGMDFDNYLSKISKNDKLVLVDFNAVWCGPCRLLKPRVDKVVEEHKDKVELLPIDVDKNPIVASTLNATSIPLLILYRNGKELWRSVGLIEESDISAQINKFSK